MTEHISDRMKLLSTKVIPGACKELSDKNIHISQVIQYLENNYLSAIHAGENGNNSEGVGGNQQQTLDTQAKTYVVDILTSIAGDIESLATNLNTYVGAQADAVDSLSNQVEVVATRLAMAKQAVALERFDEMRTDRPAQNDPMPASAAAEAIEDHKDDQDDDRSETSGAAQGEESRRETQAFYGGTGTGTGFGTGTGTGVGSGSRRLSMEERLGQLDEVGVCLKKETTAVRRSSESVANFLANPMNTAGLGLGLGGLTAASASASTGGGSAMGSRTSSISASLSLPRRPQM